MLPARRSFLARGLAAGLLSLALAVPDYWQLPAGLIASVGRSAAAAASPRPKASPAAPSARPSATPEPQDRVPGEIVSEGPKGHINWTSHKIISSGSGAPPASGSPAKRRLMAERAALADAYRNLAEIVHGVHVNAETTVEDFVTKSDIIRTQVSGLVKGAVVSHKRLLSDGSAEVDVEIPLYGQDSLMAGMVDQVLHKTPVGPSPVSSAAGIGRLPHFLLPMAHFVDLPAAPYQVAYAALPAPWTVADAGISGLIIDVHGLGLEPAMAPAILAADRHELYLGTVPVTPDTIINQGMVEYIASVDLARKSQRVGAHPLVVKAAAVSGRLKADVVLDPDTAARVTEAEAAAHFLARAAVVLVL